MYDEELDAYVNDVEELSGKIADLTKTASTPGGISLFTDADKTTYKSIYDLLKEISDIWDELSDKDQAALLETIGGKRQGQIVAATIENFEAAEKAMNTMENSMGSADREMEIITDSLDYKLNQLSQTWVGLSQDFLNLDVFKNAVDVLNVIAGGVDTIVDSFGGLQTLSVLFSGVLGGVGHGFANFDNMGNFTTIFSMFKGSSNDVLAFADAFKGLNAESKDFESQVTNLINQYPNLTKEVKQAAYAFNGSEQSLEDFNKAINNGVGASTKFITTLKNVATNMLIMVGINFAVSTFTSWLDGVIHKTEQAQENIRNLIDAADEAVQTVNELTSELDETNSQIEELEGKGDLTFVEQDELERLKEYNKELENRIANEKVLAENAQKEAKEAAEAYFTANDSYKALTTEWNAPETITETSGLGYGTYENVRGTRTEVLQAQIDNYDELSGALDKVRARMQALEETDENYKFNDEWILLSYQASVYENELDSLQDTIEDSISVMGEFMSALDPEENADIIAAFNELSAAFQNLFGGNEESLTNQFNDIWTSSTFADARAEIEALVEAGTLEPDMLEGYDELRQLMYKTGTLAESLCSHINSLVKSEKEEAKAAGEAADALSPTALSKAITEVNNLSSSFSKLENIYSSFGEDSFDLTLIDSSFEDTFSVAGKAYNDFIAVVTDGNSTIEEQQDALDNLVTAWLESSDVMKYLSEETADVIAEMLEEQGVVNATTFVYTELVKQKADTALENGELVSSIAQEITALIEESGVADDTAEAIAAYYLSKLTANDIMIATNGDIESIMELCEACKTGVAAIKAFYAAKQGYDAAVESLQTLNTSTMSNPITANVLVKSVNDAGLEGMDSLNGIAAVYKQSVDEVYSYYTEMEKQTDAVLDEIDSYIQEIGGLGGVNPNTNYRPSTTGTGSGGSGSGSGTESEPTSTIFDWIDTKIEATEKRIDELKDKIDDAVGFTAKNATTDTALDELNELLATYQSMYDMYMEQAYSYDLPEEYIDKIINGAMQIEEIVEEAGVADDQSIVNRINNFKEWYDKAQDVDDKIKDIKSDIKELNKSKLDNIINDFDNLSDLMGTYTDYRNSLISLREASGETVYEEDYESLIADQNAIYATLATQYNKVRDQYDKLLASGDIEKYTDEWYEYEKELISIQSAMADCKQEVLELEEAILDLRFQPLEEFADYIDYITDGISTLSSVIGDSNLVVDGMLTDRGLAQVALYEKGLTSAKQTVAEYGAAIDALNEMYEQGDITLEQYNERLYEYQSAQNSAIESVEDYRQSILDLCKTAIEQEIEDMEDLIQARKDALAAEKELANYQKQIAQAEQNIATLQAKIAALSGSQSREDQALRLQLESELAAAQEELAELTAEHEQETIEDALDAELEAYTQEKNDELDALEWNLDAQDAAIEKYLQEVTDNYEIVYDTLTEYGEYYGMTMIDVLTEPWDSATAATNTFVDAVSDAVAEINYSLDQIDTSSLSNLINLLNSYSNATGMTSSSKGSSSYEDVSGMGDWYQGNGGKWWYGEPYQSNGDYWYASGGTYTINGKQYAFDESGYMKTGWDDSEGEWRYFEPENGQLVKSSWRKSGGEWYYLDSNGWMARNAAIADKSGDGYYLVDSNGVCTNKDNPTPFNQVDWDRYKQTYAKGTRNAEEGVALVNEQGYEMMRTNEGDLITLKGGEDIFTAQETARLHDLAQLPLNNIIPFDRYSAEHLGADNSVLNINAPLFEVTGGLDVEMRDYIDERVDEIPEIIARYRKVR